MIWDISNCFLTECGYFNIIELISALIGFIFLCFLLIDFKFYTNFTLYFKLLIPRLIGGILIGYLPILMSSDLWKFVKHINDFEGFFIILISSVFCFYYLFTEIKNVVDDTRTAFFRSMRIWLIGLLESFLFGVVIMDLFARAFVKSFDKLDKLGEPISGLLGGQIYPKVLIIYFPLALFIGIFVQLIWEDKPITHSL